MTVEQCNLVLRVETLAFPRPDGVSTRGKQPSQPEQAARSPRRKSSETPSVP